MLLTESTLLTSERLFDAGGVNVTNLRPVCICMHDFASYLGNENQTILQIIHCRLKPRSTGGISLEIKK